MGKPQLSIIIPTYRRAEILRQCLTHLALQTIASGLEVIVVLDGPDEKTSLLLEKHNLPLSISSKTIQKSQQGVARNEGVRMARGETVLFIGDDIFLEKHACERHIASHARTPSSRSSPAEAGEREAFAVLGFTTWDSSLDITPVMRWLESSGWQFGYPMIANYAYDFVPKNIRHRFTYTSHISLPRELALQFPFREDVSLYGWEDIEWGTRLSKAGVRLYYDPGSTAVHHHRITLEQSLERMRTLGRSIVHLSEIAPDLDRKPKGLKLLKYQLAALLPTMDGWHRKAFLCGIRAASAV